jgi:hypothetical protein
VPCKQRRLREARASAAGRAVALNGNDEKIAALRDHAGRPSPDQSERGGIMTSASPEFRLNRTSRCPAVMLIARCLAQANAGHPPPGLNGM